MELSLEQIREFYKVPKKKDVIGRIIEYENRVRFHTETRITATNDAIEKNFLAFVKNLLPTDKFEIFKSLFRFPVKTNEITSACFDKLSRVFDAKDPSFNYEFTQPDDSKDWQEYRTKVLGEPAVWSTEAWERLKTQFNCVMVVDLPQEQATDKPEPYFYFLPIEYVIDYSANPKNGEMDYIIFKNNGLVYVIDGMYYRVFSEKDNELQELLSESAHGLGYAPASFFWNKPISLSNPDLKRSPISNGLGSLDWFLYFHTAKKNLDVYASYPIYYGYEEECDYHDNQGNSCSHGFLRDNAGEFLVDKAGLPVRCPVCGQHKMMGPGTYYEVPVPSREQPEIHQPVGMLSVDRASLDYNVDEEIRLKEDIVTSVVGTNEQPTQKEALNEKQVKASYDSRETIIMRIKRGFEHAQKFIDDTVCRLRYGDSFISSSINYGTEFYLYDVSELQERYRKAKESGAGEAELDALQNKIIETEYRTDKNECERMLILSELEPYRHLSREEMFKLFEKGIIDDKTMKLKMNFSNYIRRFERENSSVLTFGEGVTYKKKIDNILNTLLSYVD